MISNNKKRPKPYGGWSAATHTCGIGSGDGRSGGRPGIPAIGVA